MRRGQTRMREQSLLESGACLRELTLGSQQHPQVVMGLAQLRMAACELSEGVNGQVGFALLCQQHPLQKLYPCIIGRLFAQARQQLLSLLGLAVLQGASGALQGV